MIYLIKKYQYLFFISAISMFMLASCSLTASGNGKVKVISHQTPETTEMDLSAFQNVGCTWENDTFAPCTPDSIMQKIGCDILQKPDLVLSLLDPSLPMVKCNHFISFQDMPEEPQSQFVYQDGCSLPVFVRYVIYREGDYRLIKNQEQLKEEFAPIENPDEALAFAAAATGFQTLNGFDPPGAYRYLVETITETHVIEQQDAYEINLFTYQDCGCGPHPTSEKVLRVYPDGRIELLESRAVFEDPADDDLCID